jgi:hypothetical protein
MADGGRHVRYQGIEVAMEIARDAARLSTAPIEVLQAAAVFLARARTKISDRPMPETRRADAVRELGAAGRAIGRRCGGADKARASHGGGL